MGKKVIKQVGQESVVVGRITRSRNGAEVVDINSRYLRYLVEQDSATIRYNKKLIFSLGVLWLCYEMLTTVPLIRVLCNSVAKLFGGVF